MLLHRLNRAKKNTYFLNRFIDYCRDLSSLYVKCRKFRSIYIKNKKDIKLVLGAAGSVFEGWISTDMDILDATREINWKFLFKKNSIYAILAEHVWEHLDDAGVQKAIKNCYKYLRPGGYLRIAVPDGFHPDESYIEYVKPEGTGVGSDTHQRLYTYISLRTLFENIGFKIELLEYWDEKGQFHYNNWREEDGFILRSMNHDNRNKIKPLSYTSLIMDARK